MSDSMPDIANDHEGTFASLQYSIKEDPNEAPQEAVNAPLSDKMMESRTRETNAFHITLSPPARKLQLL